MDDSFKNSNQIKEKELNPYDDTLDDTETISQGTAQVKKNFSFKKLGPTMVAISTILFSALGIKPVVDASFAISAMDEAIRNGANFEQVSGENRLKYDRNYKMRKKTRKINRGWKKRMKAKKNVSPRLIDKYKKQGFDIETDGNKKLTKLHGKLDDGTSVTYDPQKNTKTTVKTAKNGSKSTIVYDYNLGTETKTLSFASTGKDKVISQKSIKKKKIFKEFNQDIRKNSKMRANIRKAESFNVNFFKSESAKKSLASFKAIFKPIKKRVKKNIANDSDANIDGKTKNQLDGDIDPDQDEFGINEAANANEMKVEDIENSRNRVNSIDGVEGSDTGRFKKSRKIYGKIANAKSTKKISSIVNSKGAGLVSTAFEGVNGFVAFFFKLRALILNDKMTKMLSLAGYAAIMLSTFSSIKAGDSTEEETAKVLNILTATRPLFKYNKYGKTKENNYEYSKTAFDSQGFRYLSNGNKILKDTAPDESLKKYQIGATGKVAYYYNSLDSKVTNNVASESIYNFQETIGSSIGGQIIGGLIALVIGVLTGGASVLITMAGSQVVSMILGNIKGYLMQILITSMLGMTVNSLTEGEDAGNAIASGSLVLLSSIAMRSGNLPLTKKASLAYIEDQNNLIALKAKEIEATHSPFDTSTRYTILGRIKFAMLPYKYRLTSFAGIIGSIIHMSKNSFVNLLPSSHAISNQAEIKNAFNYCNDPTITNSMKIDQSSSGENNDIALTPFCTPIVGVPVNYLENNYFSPENVLQRFGMDPNSIDLMWEHFKQNPKSEDYDAYDKTSYSNFSKNFRPKDEDGYCNFVKAESSEDRARGKNIYTNWTEQEKNNPCNKDWFWAINDRAYQGDQKGYQYLYNSTKGKWEWVEKGTIKYFADTAKLNEFKVNCIERDKVPLGMVDKVLNNGTKESNDSWLSDFFGLEAFKAKSLKTGAECLVSGSGERTDRQRVDFGLYFMDLNIEEIINK